MMNCSDCQLWKTDECRLNPEAEDLDNAETFACFVPVEGKDETVRSKARDEWMTANTKRILGWFLFGLGLAVLIVMTPLLGIGFVFICFPAPLVGLVLISVGWWMSHPTIWVVFRKVVGWFVLIVGSPYCLFWLALIIFAFGYGTSWGGGPELRDWVWLFGLIIVWLIVAATVVIGGWWLVRPMKFGEHTQDTTQPPDEPTEEP